MYSHPFEVELPRIVSVEAVRRERVELEEALGQDMRRVLVAVLQEQGAALGWGAGGREGEYVLALARGPVRLRIDVGAHPLAIVREASAAVEEALAGPTAGRLEGLLGALSEEAELALNRLWDGCYQRSLEEAARALGEVVERVATRGAEAQGEALLLRIRTR